MFFLNFQITTQNEIMNNVSLTHVLDILDAISSISEDKDVIILTDLQALEPARDSKKPAIIYDDETDYETSETDDEEIKYFNEQFDLQPQKQKNILRWLPKKKRNRGNKIEREKQAVVEADKVKVISQNAARVKYIVSVIKNNHAAADFLYNEVIRIRRDRKLVDEIREVTLRAETPGLEKVKQNIIDCFKKAKAEADAQLKDTFWMKPFNNLVINTVKDTLNDGVRSPKINGY